MAIIKHRQQRVAVFIDAQNLYHSAKNLYQKRVNFGAILQEAVGGRQLVRAVAYVIRTESGEESAFFEALQKLGIETRVKDLQVFYGGAKKADWDVGLAIDAVSIASKVDAIVIASGDGDYIPLLEYVRYATGTQVEVISFGKSTSGKLKETADHFTDLGDRPGMFLLGGARRMARQSRAPESSAPVTE